MKNDYLSIEMLYGWAKYEKQLFEEVTLSYSPYYFPLSRNPSFGTPPTSNQADIFGKIPEIFGISGLFPFSADMPPFSSPDSMDDSPIFHLNSSLLYI